MTENRNTPGVNGSTGNTSAAEPSSISLVSLVFAMAFVAVCASVFGFAFNASNGDDRKQPTTFGTHQLGTGTPTPSAINELSKGFAARAQLNELGCKASVVKQLNDSTATRLATIAQDYKIRKVNRSSASPYSSTQVVKDNRIVEHTVLLQLTNACQVTVKIEDRPLNNGQTVVNARKIGSDAIMYEYPTSPVLTEIIFKRARPDAACINYGLPHVKIMPGPVHDLLIKLTCTNPYNTALPEFRKRVKN